MVINKSVWVRKRYSAFQVETEGCTSTSSPAVQESAVVPGLCAGTRLSSECRAGLWVPSLDIPLGNWLLGSRLLRAAACERALQALVPGKEQTSLGAWKLPHTGMCECTQGIGKPGQTLCPQQARLILKWGLSQRGDPASPALLPFSCMCASGLPPLAQRTI